MGKTRSRSRGQQGGLAAYPPSAWGNVLATAGTGWNQFMNTLSLSNPSQSNVLVLENINRSGGNMPANANAKTMTGGRKRHRKRSLTRSRRGGNLGPVLYQAAAPLTLLAMNQMAKRRFKNRSFKNRR